MEMRLPAAVLTALLVFFVSGAISLSPTKPKSMKSDFADFIMKSNYAPQLGPNSKVISQQSANQTAFRDFYDVLGVKREDDMETIKREYYKRAKACHPGKHLHGRRERKLMATEEVSSFSC